MCITNMRVRVTSSGLLGERVRFRVTSSGLLGERVRVASSGLLRS